MQQGTVSVRPSVRLSHLSTAAATCGGLLLWARRAGDIDRHRRRPCSGNGAAAARRSAAKASSHVVS